MMDPKIAGKILDRIAELSQGNEQRTMEYLSNSQSSGAERQRRLRDKKIAQGLIRMEVWATPDNAEILKERFPGPRAGIDWEAVIAAALAGQNRRQGDP